MKTFLATILLVVSIISFAETISDERVRGMVTVLESKEFNEFLQREGAVGNITSIEHAASTINDVAIRFKVNFLAYSFLSEIKCTVIARVDGSNGTGSVSLDRLECKKSAELSNTGSDVCRTPSPTGCLD